MDSWQKESLNLKVGDFIIWQDEAIEVEGQPAVVAPGMKGKVLSLHDGFHLENLKEAIRSLHRYMVLSLTAARCEGESLSTRLKLRHVQTWLK